MLKDNFCLVQIKTDAFTNLMQFSFLISFLAKFFEVIMKYHHFVCKKKMKKFKFDKILSKQGSRKV